MDRNVGSGFPRGLGKGRVYPDGHRVGRRRPIQGMQDARCRMRASWTGFSKHETGIPPGTRYRIDAEGRMPGTGDRAKRARRVCKIQDADLMCAFSGSQTWSSVLGVRPSALIRYRVPGLRWHPTPGTRYQ